MNTSKRKKEIAIIKDKFYFYNKLHLMKIIDVIFTCISYDDFETNLLIEILYIIIQKNIFRIKQQFRIL